MIDGRSEQTIQKFDIKQSLTSKLMENNNVTYLLWFVENYIRKNVKISFFSLKSN